MSKLIGDRKQKVFFRIVSIAFLTCLGCLLKYSFPQNGGEPAATMTSTKSEKTKKPDKVPTATLQPDNQASRDTQKDKEALSSQVAKIPVRGIYLTGPVAGSIKKRNELVNLVETTKLNAMVIDVKNDSGEITYKMDYEKAKEAGAIRNYISDMPQMIKELKAKNIYLIARIVTFKDPILAESNQEYSIRNEDGSVFRDNKGLAWLNPYNREVWKYVLNIAAIVAELGFDEIQFDYIRFPTAPGMDRVTYGAEEKLLSKQEVITQFTQCVSNCLKDRGVKVSADVFGGVISSEVDSKNIGQDYEKMSQYLDCICPMIYPSQFAKGCYGVDNPDASPYEIVYRALKDSQTKLENNKDVVVRPWLQDFTATWIDNHATYDAKKIRSQIDAVYASGYNEWILWNASNCYTEGGLPR